jgi:hypothetical protein
MTVHSHWNTVAPTIHHFDGRCYQVPDFVAANWMHSGSACAHIKYCYSVHSDLVNVVDDQWQYDDFWHEWINLAQIGEAPWTHLTGVRSTRF